MRGSQPPGDIGIASVQPGGVGEPPFPPKTALGPVPLRARAQARLGTRWWQRAPWGHPRPLTSLGPGLVGEPWEPETREKGLRGLVRLAELRGLAGLLELYVPEGPMATAERSRNKRVHHGLHLPEHVPGAGAAPCRGTPGFMPCQGRDGPCSPRCLAVSVPRDGLFFRSPSITSWIRQISFWICRLSISFWRGEKRQQSEHPRALPPLPAPPHPGPAAPQPRGRSTEADAAQGGLNPHAHNSSPASSHCSAPQGTCHGLGGVMEPQQRGEHWGAAPQWHPVPTVPLPSPLAKAGH